MIARIVEKVFHQLAWFPAAGTKQIQGHAPQVTRGG